MAGGDGTDVDVVVVGAGFAGLYAAHRFRLAGLSMRIIEAGDDIGGTWYWNRYPGARVDIPSVDYMFSFDPDWSRDWQWSEKYATQPEILRYLNHVADKHDLRRDIQFGAKVTHAHWDDNSSAYCVRTDRGDEIACRYLVMATGCLSMPKQLDIDGVENFTREVYFTSRWPHQGVDFTGKRVAVVGTGSSGIQSIPLIAAQAAQLVVFQRTPCFSIPAHNGPISPDKLAQLADETAYRQAARNSFGGVPVERTMISDLLGVCRRTSAAIRKRLAARRTAGGAQPLHRRDEQSGGQRRLCRIRPRQDSRHGGRSTDGGRTVPHDLSDRRQEAVPGYRLLRHVQSAACAAGEPAEPALGKRYRNRNRHGG